MTPTRYDTVTLRVYKPLGMGWHRWGLYHTGRALKQCPPTMISSNSQMSYVPQRDFGPKLPKHHLEGSAVFGGVFYTHFGHFLVETLISLAYLAPRITPEDRLVFLRPPYETRGAYPEFVLWFLQTLGIAPEQIHICDSDTQVKQLDLYDSPFRGKARYHRAALDALDTLPLLDVPAHGRKLYISRITVPKERQRLVNGDTLEAFFNTQGYESISPETLTIEEQIPLLLGAQSLAGENGSGLHWSLLSRHIETVTSLGWHLPLQKGICDARRQKYINIRHPILGPFLPRKQEVPLRAATRALQKLR